MGTWGTGIKENDTVMDVYSEFISLYNSGESPKRISEWLIAENKDLINDEDEKNNFWFGLALAQWETKSLDPHLYEKVKSIIESGDDIRIWRNLEAEKKDIEKREAVLYKFLEKLKAQKSKALPRRKPKVPVLKTGTCFTFRLYNENYGGAIVLSSNTEEGMGFNLIATTRINSPKKPLVSDFLDSEVLFTNCPGNFQNSPEVGWYPANGYKKKYSSVFEIIGKIEIKKEYNEEDDGGSNDFLTSMFCGDWSGIIENCNKQFLHEHGNARCDKKVMVKEII